MKNEKLKGRILRIRDHGNIVFLDLRTLEKTEQLAIRKESLGEDYASAKEKLNRGDIVGVKGVYFSPNSGQRTLDITDYHILTPCHSPEKIKMRPKKRICRRSRGLELLAYDESIERFRRAALIGQTVRSYLYDRGFIEVDTGILRPTTDTSKAREFTTQAAWNNREMFLRKSMEQRLKQLLVGGLGDVFELGKVFRNEDSTRDFSPEFTALELYKTHGDYRYLLRLMKGLLKKIDQKVGSPPSNPSEFEEVQFYDFLNECTGTNVRRKSRRDLEAIIPPNKRKDYPEREDSRGYLLHDLFESLIKRETERNITIIGYPTEITVLSKSSDKDPSLAEEFRMFVGGRSYCYGCTELTDYKEQRERIKKQKDFWGKPSDRLDPAFMEMLKIGLPPCAGLGLSLERLQAIYLNEDNLKDIILFPI